MKIYLGEVDYNGRKNCKAFLSWELKDKNGQKIFTAQAQIYNPRGDVLYIGGQCLNEVREICQRGGVWTSDAEKIFIFWKLYHLNNLNAGTVEQERILEILLPQDERNYENARKALKSVGMEIVPLTKNEAAENPHAPNPYAYGEAWLYRPIPDAIIKQIEALSK